MKRLLIIVIAFMCGFTACGGKKEVKEFVIPEGMQRIGAEDYGFVTVPDTWVLDEEDSRNTIRLRNPEKDYEYIRITIGRVDLESDLEDVRRFLEIQVIDSGIELEYKEIVELGDYEAWKMSSLRGDYGRIWYAFLIHKAKLFSRERYVVVIHVAGTKDSHLVIDGYVEESYFINVIERLATSTH